jgi:hypothetical protein
MKTHVKINLWTLPLLVIGLTWFYIYMVSNGLNVPWKFVGKPSEKIAKITGFNSGKLYVETDSGEMYSLHYYHFGDSLPPPDQWDKDNKYKKELDPIYESSYGYTAFKSPPPLFKIKQIYQLSFPAVESSNLTKFALSEDGNLWYWAHAGGGFEGLFYFLILAGEILLYVLALIIKFVIF